MFCIHPGSCVHMHMCTHADACESLRLMSGITFPCLLMEANSQNQTQNSLILLVLLWGSCLSFEARIAGEVLYKLSTLRVFCWSKFWSSCLYESALTSEQPPSLHVSRFHWTEFYFWNLSPSCVGHSKIASFYIQNGLSSATTHFVVTPNHKVIIVGIL